MFGYRPKGGLLRLSRLLLIVLCGLLITQAEGLNEPRIFVKTRDLKDFRRIMLKFSMPVPFAQLPKPKFGTEPESGDFKILLQGIPAQRFFGPLDMNDKSGHPLRYAVTFPDSMSISIQGRTLPFERMTAAYVFSENCYIFDVFYSRPLESLYLEKSYSGPYLSASNNDMADDAVSSKTWWKYLIRALPLAAAAFVLMSVIGYLIYHYYSRQKPAVSRRDDKIHEVKTMLRNNAEKIKAGQDNPEQLINKIAKDKGISYDEAALLVKMSEGEQRVDG